MLSCRRNKTMQKDKHTFKRARLYFTSSSVCTFQSDCSALLPPPCQAACFTRSSALKASTVFAKKTLQTHVSQGLCVSTNAQELVCSVRERVFVCLCVRSSVAGADRPKGPSGSCEAAAVRCLGPVRGHATASAAAVPLPPFVFFFSSNTTYLTEKTSRIPPDSPTALPPAGRVCLRVGRIRPKKCLGHRRASATVNLCEIPACS